MDFAKIADDYDKAYDLIESFAPTPEHVKAQGPAAEEMYKLMILSGIDPAAAQKRMSEPQTQEILERRQKYLDAANDPALAGLSDEDRRKALLGVQSALAMGLEAIVDENGDVWVAFAAECDTADNSKGGPCDPTKIQKAKDFIAANYSLIMAETTKDILGIFAAFQDGEVEGRGGDTAVALAALADHVGVLESCLEYIQESGLRDKLAGFVSGNGGELSEFELDQLMGAADALLFLDQQFNVDGNAIDFSSGGGLPFEQMFGSEGGAALSLIANSQHLIKLQGLFSNKTLPRMAYQIKAEVVCANSSSSLQCIKVLLEYAEIEYGIDLPFVSDCAPDDATCKGNELALLGLIQGLNAIGDNPISVLASIAQPFLDWEGYSEDFDANHQAVLDYCAGQGLNDDQCQQAYYAAAMLGGAKALGGGVGSQVRRATNRGPVTNPTAAQSTTATQYGVDPRWVKADGTLDYPPNNGFVGAPVSETLPVGTKIDRYGGNNGSFFAPSGTPFDQRAMPGSAIGEPNQFVVLKPLPTQSGPAAPWFDKPGGGTQYQTGNNVKWLLDNGFIDYAN